MMATMMEGSGRSQCRKPECGWRFGLLPLLLAGAVVTAGVSGAAAGPKDGKVVRGDATIQQSGKKTLVNQKSGRAIVNWKSFDVDHGEAVSFQQPGKKAIIVNRVTGGDVSDIQGAIKGNGQVWLINPAGILFGPTATVDVQGLLATTSNLSDADVMEDNFNFWRRTPHADAQVVNQGEIAVARGGLAVLAAPQVRNEGLIAGKVAQVVLAGVPAFAIDFDGDGLLSFVANGVLNVPPGSVPVSNSGVVRIEGGSVLLTAAVAKKVVRDVINVAGVIEAQSTRLVDGRVILDGGTDTDIAVEGVVRARSGGDRAGEAAVDIDGHEVVITGTVAGSDVVRISGKRIATADDGIIRGGRLDIDSSAAAGHPVGGQLDIATDIDVLSIGRDAPENTVFATASVDNAGDLVIRSSGGRPGADVKTLVLQVEGTLKVADPIVATGAGDAVVVDAHQFVNRAGPGAVQTPNGRSIIYSVDPRQDDLGNLPGKPIVGSINETPPETIDIPGNVFVYRQTAAEPRPQPKAIEATVRNAVTAPTTAPDSSAERSQDEALAFSRSMIKVAPVAVDGGSGDLLFANDGNSDLWGMTGGH